MRADQLERLAEMSEKLAEVAIDELNPDAWPGAGKALKDQTQQERGDRYWCKKNGAATLSLVHRLVNLVQQQTGIGGRHPMDERDLDRELREAEKEASKLVNDAMKATRHNARSKA